MKSLKGELNASLLEPADVLQSCCALLVQRSGIILFACSIGSNWKPNRILEISKAFTNSYFSLLKSLGFLLSVLWAAAENVMQNVEIVLPGSEQADRTS